MELCGAKPCVLIVTPYALFPPSHGGARRLEALFEVLRDRFEIVLLSDEADLYTAAGVPYFKTLASAHLVGGRVDAAHPQNRSERIVTHSHGGLAEHLKFLMEVYSPAIIQIEYVELSKLIELRTGASCHWFLTEHDVLTSDDGCESIHDSNERSWVTQYDGVIVCSEEDARLVSHDNVFTVSNGAALRNPYKPSPPLAPLLFMGPFRYPPNRVGIQEFLRLCWASLRQRVPWAQLWILGGHDAPRIASALEGFGQSGVRVIDYSENPQEWVDQCALTINPLQNVRGSCLKVIESLAAGRVCVSTLHGARGYLNKGLEGLIVTSTVGDFVEPIERLLLDDSFRRSRERPSWEVLKPFSWDHAGDLQTDIYKQFLRTGDSKWTTKS